MHINVTARACVDPPGTDPVQQGMSGVGRYCKTNAPYWEEPLKHQHTLRAQPWHVHCACMYALSSYEEFGKVSQALPDTGLARLDLGTYSVSGAYDVRFG